MRDSMVTNGVTFLTHPKVRSTPLAERLEFLRNKGLTQEEIDEAINQANEQSPGSATETPTPATTPSASVIPNPDNPVAPDGGPATVVYQQMPPPEQPWWVRTMIPATLALSAGAGIAFLYKTMVLNEKRGIPWNAGPFGGFFGPPPNMPPPPMQIQDGAMQQPNSPQGPVNGPAGVLANGGFGDKSAMFGQAPYANGAEAAMSALVPRSNGNGPPDAAIAKTNEQVEKLCTVVERQSESVNQLCDTMKDTLNVVAKSLEALSQTNNNQQKPSSSIDDSKLLQVLLANQSNQTLQSELKSELAAIRTLLLAQHGGSAVPQQTADAAAVTTTANDAKTTATLEDEQDDTSSTVAPAATMPEKKTTNPIDDLLKKASAPTSTTTPIVEPATTPDTQQGAGEETKVNIEDKAKEETMLQGAREALAKMIDQEKDTDKLVSAVKALIMYLRNLNKGVPRFRRITRSNSSFKKALAEIDGHVDFLRAVGFEEKLTSVSGSSTSPLEWSEEWVKNKDGWAKVVIEDAVTNLEAVKNKFAPPPTNPNNGMVGISAAPVNGNKDAPQVGEDAKPDQPAYPLMFDEVMKMVQEGKELPGIKKIPNTLSEDSASLLNGDGSAKPSQPKPWEEMHSNMAK